MQEQSAGQVEQFSPFALLHILSPQIGVQTLGVLIQLKPDSILHVELHPSPETAFPSSHVSVPVISPSPQIGVQTLGVPTQV